MIRQARRSLLLTTALAGTLLHGAARGADLPVPTDPATTGLTYNGANTRLDVDLNNTNRIINWNSFDVAKDNVVNFTTANTATRYSVLNRVAAGDASDIFGTISTSTSNIAVWLVNPSGITFGATGAFNGGSLVLTTAAVSDANWANAIAAADPASYLVPLTGAPVPAAAAITLVDGSTITATGGRFVAAAQSVTAAGKITATGSEAELVAATDLSLPFGAGSPLGVQIDKGTAVGKVTAAGTAEINASVVRLAGASTGAQAAYLLQVDDGAQLTASVAGGKVILVAGVAQGGVTLSATPANVSGAASISYDGKTNANGTGGTAALYASGDITTTTTRGTISSDLNTGLTATNIAEAASLTAISGNVGVSASNAAAVHGAVSAGANYDARGRSLTLGTAGTAILQQAKGTVQVAATDGLLSGLDGLTLQSGSAGAASGIELIQSGTGGIAFAAGTELIGGTFAAGPPVTYGFGADVVVSSIAAGQPLTLGNVHARALTLPAGLTGTITVGDIVVNDTLTLNTTDSIRLRSGTSRTGDVAITATGDVTGLALPTAATDGRLATGYDRADLTAQTADKKATVGAATAQLGAVTAGTGLSFGAGEQVAVDAAAIDVTSATASNGSLRLTSTVGEARLGSGNAGLDAAITGATSVRLGTLTAATGTATATANAGDVTGLALPAAATDGRLVAGYGRAGVTAQGVAVRATVTAANGYAQLATISAGSGTLTTAGEQVVVDARAIDVTSATSFNNALRLTSSQGEVRLGTGIGGSDATVSAATSARIGSLTATRGDAVATAISGDVTGLARTTDATDGRLVAGYDRADVAALANTRTVKVMAAAGSAQLGTVTAGAGTGSVTGDGIAVDAQAIDVAAATATNDALRLTSTVGEVRLGTGTGGTDATVNAATSARIGSLTARTGTASATANDGDVTGLALAAPATDGRLVTNYARAALTAQAAAGKVTVTAASGYAQLGAVTAGSGTTTAAGEQAGVDARAIDVTSATTQNGTLRLTSTVGEVRLGTGTGGTDAAVRAATSARIGSLTARNGAASVTATAGDITGLARTAPATDGRPIVDYDRADLAAQAATGTVAATAAAGTAQLGTIAAGTGTTPLVGDQATVDARLIDVASATTSNGALRLTSTVDEVRIGSGTGGTDATVLAATNARIGSLTATTGTASATATAGDVTGLVLPAAATDGRLIAAYGRADLAAQAAAGTITVKAAAGTAQLGTAAAGTGTTTAGGEQLGVDAQAIDVATATASNRALRLTSTLGEVRLGTGTGGTDATISAATSARIGSLTTATGNAAITATSGDVTGFALPTPATDGRLVAGYGRANVAAQAATGTVTVKAAVGLAQLDSASAGTGTTALAGDQVAVDAQAIDVLTATTLNGALRLTSSVGEVRLVTGTSGSDGIVQAATSARIGSLTTATGDINITATAGDVTGLILATPATDGRLVDTYGRADLTAQAADRTIAVTANAGYAQLGTVIAGTGTTTPAGDQIAVDARAIDAISTTAQNGALRLASTVSEVRVASGHGGTSGTVDAMTNARVGDLTTRTGAIAVTARGGDATGLALATPATDSRPESAHGLTTLNAGTSIAVKASDDVQLGAIQAGTDIDIDAHPADPTTATANEVAWMGGTVTATTGHYRVTGGSVVLGAPGGVGQGAGADLIVRSLAGDIGGGDALGLFSGVGSTSAASQLILYSAGAITLPANSTLSAGAGQYADIGLATPAGMAITLGTASARRIGTAAIDATQPTGYRIDQALVLPNPITARRIVTAADLVIDTTRSNTTNDIALDEAQSTAGGINLATFGNLRGQLLSAPATYQRTKLTAFDGVVVTSGLALLDTVTAGTGVDIAAGRLDALAITANAGDVALLTDGDMLVDSVVAHGDGGNGLANLLADPTIPLSSYATPGIIRTAGDIRATSSGDITGTTAGTTGLANFTATNGAVTILSDATTTGKGLLALDTVSAGGVTPGHTDASLTGRQIDVATSVGSTFGSTFVTARELGSQTQVGATIARASAARDVTIAIGYGTASGGTADNGSLRFGTVQTTAGNVTITAQDGSVTGMPGIADGLDPLHARPTISAGGNVTVAAGKLVQLGELSGQDAAISAGDDVLADVAQQGTVAHQDGAIDIAHLAARGSLMLTAAHGSTADGVSGIRLGALASGLSDGGVQSSAGTTATIQTLGSLGDVIVADGLTAQGQLTATSIANIRASTLTSATGGIALTASGGDVTGLVLPVAATDGRMIANYDRADLTTQAAGQPITVQAAAGIAQLGTVTAGTGTSGSAGEQFAVDAQAIDVATATTQNGAIRLSSTLGEVRLATGTANTDATIAAASNARVGTLTTRNGSILATATTGDVTGLLLPAAAGDGRLVPDYDRASLTAQAFGTGVTVAAAAGIAQLGPVTAGAGDTTATTGGIAVDARAIDVSTATAQNATLRLTSTAGEVRLVTGTAGTDATIGAATSARIGTLTTRTGSIGVTATTGDVTGLALATSITDGRPIPAYGRAELTAQAAAASISVTANAGTAQLGPLMAGTGDTTAPTGGIAVDAALIDVTTATAQNAALRLTSSVGEVRLGTGIAGTDANIGAATSARIGMLATRTGSILATATNGDVTGLVLPAVAGDGRTVPEYDRADLISQAIGSGIAVTAAAGIAQLGPVLAGTGDTTTTTGGIAVDARAIDVSSATAQNAALRLSSTAGEVRLVTGIAGTDANIGAATSARIGTLTSRTGSIGVTASGGDVTGLALIPAATDGRMVPDYDRAVLTAQAERTNVTVNATGIAQLGSVTAGTGAATSMTGGIAVTARAIDLLTADARNAALKLTSTIGETRLVTGSAGTDATILAADAARIGTLTTRTGGIAVTATAGDVTGLIRAMPADDGRLVAAYDRADLTTLAAAQPIAVTAAAGNVQLGTALAGTGTDTSAGDQIAVDALAIDVITATAQNGALRLTASGGEARLSTGTAGTAATILAASNARIGSLTTRTGSIIANATTGDVTGLALTPVATDGRMVPGFDRPVLTTQAFATNIFVGAGGIAQLGIVRAGDATVSGTATSGGITVDAGAIDLADANAFNAGLKLTSILGETRLVTGVAATDATILAANAARIGTLTTRTGSIGVIATAGDVTGLILPAAVTDGRLVPTYYRAELTAQAAGKGIAVKAAAGAVQLDMASAGTGATTSDGEQIAVDAQAIDVLTATTLNGALRLTSTAGEARLAAGTAGTDATIKAASNARLGTLTTRTGSIAVTATGGDVTGLLLPAPATDGRMLPGYGRADLTAQAVATNIGVSAKSVAQLGTVLAGTGDTTAPTGGIAVTAGSIDLITATAQNAVLQLTSNLGETRLMTGTAGTDATILAANAARIGTLTTRTGSIAIAATAGDVTGLLLATPANDGRMVPGYGRADLTAQAAATNIGVTAKGVAQLGTVQAGTGDTTAPAGGISVTAGSIDLATATARNAALQLTSNVGETRLGAGTAGTDATVLTATSARIGTLGTRTGSIAVTATAGDVTGLVLAPAATDGRIVPGYNRADLTAQAAGTNVTVTAAAGTAQLGSVTAGAGDTTAPAGGIAVNARAIDVATAAARNAALRLASTAGDVRLQSGTAGTDATIQAAANARIGTLAARTGSIAVTAGMDATGLAADPAIDGRLAPAFGRADLAAQAAARDVTVTAGGAAQIGTVSAGTGTATSAGGGIAVTAGAIDITTATAQNAALALTANTGETRLATGTAATDATILAATNARIGTLTTRTGSIAATATAGDATGLALANAAADGRMATGYGRADLTASAAAKTIAVKAAAGIAQLGAVTAGTGGGNAGEQVAVDARAIDVTSAAAQDGALRLASTAGETRLVTGNAATDATINAAASARIGDLASRTGAIALTATAGDVTGIAATGRANLTAPSPTKSITVTAAAGTALLGTVTAGADALSTGGGGIAVNARGIDVTNAAARNGALALTATADRLYLGQGIAATTATLDKRGTADELHVTGSLAAPGNVTLASTTDIDLPVTPAVIASGDTLVVRNSGASATSLGSGATGAGFTLTDAEVNSLKAPKLMIDSRANAVTITNLAIAAAAGSGEVDLLGTGGFTLRGGIVNTGGGARTLQLGGAAASATAPNEAAIEAGTTLASSITGELENGAAIDWTGGTLDLRSNTILFGNQALRNVAVGTPEGIAVNLVARSNSALYIGAIGTSLQNKNFLTALKLRVSYTGYALFQNTNLPAVPTGAVIGPQDRSVTTLSLQLYSTGETPANSFAVFGTINGFQGRTAGVLPADVVDFADLNPRVVRITQSNSRINGCVIGSPDKGCLVTDAPPPNFQLFDERQIQLFGTADDAGLTFDPLIGTNNESLIGDIDQGTLGINSIDCTLPGTPNCPAPGEKQ